MPKQILFVIHGIGAHQSDWAELPDGPIQTLAETARSYAYLRSHPLESRVAFVAVQYDEIFRDTIARWQADAAELQRLDPSGGLSAALGWLAGATETEKTFWWSHLADLALYRFSPIYRQRVRIHVIDQIARRLEQALREDGAAAASVLAHSMGTAVTHDALHLLGTRRWGERANPLNPRHWRFQHLFMVANTSRLLQTDDDGMAKAYDSIVRPGATEDPNSYTATYFNVRHEADPVPYPGMFEPVDWPPNRYTSLVVQHYWAPNVHGLSHYLRNPRVHIPVFQKLVGPRAVAPDEARLAVDQFPQFGGRLAAVEKARAFAARAAELQARLGRDPAPAEWIHQLVRFFSLTEEFR